jgi:hypothetical protein
VDGIREHDHLVGRKSGHESLVLGNESFLLGLIRLGWHGLWFLVHKAQTTHQLGGS